MSIHRYYLADFVAIQRQSFFSLLETGVIEEFTKRNPITSFKQDFELVFYPEYYRLTRPEYSPHEAIVKNKSYTSKLFIPVQLIDKKKGQILLNWVYIGNLPIMTKRGHFILNGAARVIVNQILRSPGIYYQQKIYENYEKKWSQNPEDTFKRYYADLICMRGTWLRIEMDKEKKIWAQMKKGPKIPIYWFLLAMGISEKKIFNSIQDSYKLLSNLEGAISSHVNILPFISRARSSLQTSTLKSSARDSKDLLDSASSKAQLLKEQRPLLPLPPLNVGSLGEGVSFGEALDSLRSSPLEEQIGSLTPKEVVKEAQTKEKKYPYLKTPIEAWKHIYELLISKKNKEDKKKQSSVEEGRKWLYNRFLNFRFYDLGKQGRLSFNRKLGLNISPTQLTLTGLDVLYATDYLIKVEKGVFKIDDIDHLKNRRVRTSGELIQIQIGIGLVRLEKSIRDTLNKVSSLHLRNDAFVQNQKFKKNIKNPLMRSSSLGTQKVRQKSISNRKSSQDFSLASFSPHSSRDFSNRTFPLPLTPFGGYEAKRPHRARATPVGPRREGKKGEGVEGLTASIPFFEGGDKGEKGINNSLTISSLINPKAFNSAIREFFGTSPLSQFMDQINPLAELTHKRRLSSMGPGGVTRDTATLAIRGIHPTHYGRICPIETPEGKNTGLVNSMTTYARVNRNGFIESPFYKVYKGQVQKKTGMYFFSAEQEEKITLAASDLAISAVGFLPKALIPIRITEDFTKIGRSSVQYIGVSPLQMISIAASLIPFLEHDDANRALMGSNMQRQAVPLIRPERAFVGTGLEARAVSDSGHTLISKYSGFVTYVSAQKICIYSLIY